MLSDLFLSSESGIPWTNMRLLRFARYYMKKLFLIVLTAIKEHHEIITGYDFGLNNRVKGSLAENNFMNASTPFISGLGGYANPLFTPPIDMLL